MGHFYIQVIKERQEAFRKRKEVKEDNSEEKEGKYLFQCLKTKKWLFLTHFKKPF